MQVANSAPLLLSNYEVFAHLTAQKQLLDPLIAAQQSQFKRRRFAGDLALYEGQSDAEKRKKFPKFQYPKELDPDLGKLTDGEEKLERLNEVRGVTVTGGVVLIQDAVLKYFSQPEHPTLRQSAEGIENVLSELAVVPLELTKAEMYMICNLCPASQVALYVIVEEIDTRSTPEEMDQIIELVESSLSAPPALPITGHDAHGGDYDEGMDDEEMQMQQMEEEFVHEAEWGADKEAGVEDEKDGELDS